MPLMGVPVPALALAGLTPELRRAAKRRRLERTVRPTIQAQGDGRKSPRDIGVDLLQDQLQWRCSE